MKRLITIVALISALIIPVYVFGAATELGTVAVSNSPGNPNISVDDGGNVITTDGQTAVADDVTTSSNAVNVNAFLSELEGTTQDRVRHSFRQELTGVNANAVQTTIDMVNTPMNRYTVIVDRTAGATDVVDIELQCSIDNTAFVTILSILTLAGEPVIANPMTNNIPCARLQIEVIDVGAGNTLAIQTLAVR